MQRKGFFYDFGYNTWTQVQFPSFSPFVFVDEFEDELNIPENTLRDFEQQPNGYHTFRGKPTIFGSTENCDTRRRCRYTEIIQYEEWDKLYGTKRASEEDSSSDEE